jgi:WD40 repeat protein
LHSVASGRVTATLRGHDTIVYALAFPPSAAVLASADDAKVVLWQVRSAKQRASLGGHADRISAIALSPDGRLLASGSAPPPPKGSRRQKPGEIRFWDVGTGTELAAVELRGQAVVGLAFSADGTRLAAGGSGGTVTLWALAGRKMPVR